VSPVQAEPVPPPTVEAQLSSSGVTMDQRAGIAVLADRIYGHVLRVVMLDRLYMVEQIVWGELLRLGFPDESGELATALLSEALHRVGYSPERCVSTIPDGISEDEILAAEYDDDCVFCRCEVADMQYRLSGRKCHDLQRDAEEQDLRQFFEQAAKAWRADNAEALRRFGLA